jgi:hypothetical protein
MPPTPALPQDTSAPLAHRSMQFQSDAERMKMIMRTPFKRFSCILIVRNFFLLLQTRAVAQLAYSNDSDSIVKNKLILEMAMRLGFLWVGWQPEILSLGSGMEWPAVSVSSLGGTVGTSIVLCNFSILI